MTSKIEQKVEEIGGNRDYLDIPRILDFSRLVSMNLEKKFLHPDQSGRSGVPDLDNLDASG